MKKRLASDANALPEVAAAKGRRGGAASASVAANACGATQPAWMAAILKEVEELGRMPKRFKTPKTNEERAENLLSKRIAKHKNDFPKEVWENMQEMKEKGQTGLQERQIHRCTACTKSLPEVQRPKLASIFSRKRCTLVFYKGSARWR